MNLYKIFRDFLVRRGCVAEFDQAFYTAYPGYCLDETLWVILGGDECFLGRVFDWEQTPQGRGFWADIDKEWYNLYLFDILPRMNNGIPKC